MMKKLTTLIFLIFLTSCSSIEFVLNEQTPKNNIKNNVYLVFEGNKEERLTKELYYFFGNVEGSENFLVTSFSEKKENRLVKKNQVAEKTDYELIIDYKILYKNKACKAYNKKIITKFSFVPKSFGYNFGTDKSLEKLYKESIRKNIRLFIDSIPNEKNCT